MDTIFIEQLELSTIVGIYSWEQQKPRPIVIDLELDLDLRPAAASDHLRDTVNYKAVCDDIEQLIRDQRYQLVESLAETISRRLFSQFPIQRLRLKVGKPGAVTVARTVGVRIERRREDYAVCGR